MTKAVVYSLLATAFLLFLVFSPTSPKGPNHLRVGRRLGYKHAAFDPLVGKMERLAEEGGFGDRNAPVIWESNPFSGEFEDTEEYFSEEGRLNITLRLVILFPLLDRAPQDGVVSFKELEAWNLRQASDRLNYSTQREITLRDKDGDGAISLKEYLPKLSDEDIGMRLFSPESIQYLNWILMNKCETERNSMVHGQAGWWKEQFTNADADSDGILNFQEFNEYGLFQARILIFVAWFDQESFSCSFLHPEDSGNGKIQQWLLREKIKGMDYDNDGKLDFNEFHNRAYDTYKNYIEFESADDSTPKAEDIFAKLDLNMDKFLTEEELQPILHHLHPGELSYATHYTKYLIREVSEIIFNIFADDNKDGNLTLNEMIDHEYIFYSTVFEESDYDDDDDDLHDEF
ncbi:hypothetical protein HHK36_000053 [Tetracentron sinense]|uniref:EF-hand domain-containing protein n=1 Tax=Tetracentron sinense TaxID=13715 RepID=A0A835DQJ0_TETSI|nr:hypothetical protein HHK36_000053 [Tetracentron sinense]